MITSIIKRDGRVVLFDQHKIAAAISQAVEESQGGIQEMLDDAAMAVMVLNGGSAVPLFL